MSSIKVYGSPVKDWTAPRRLHLHVRRGAGEPTECHKRYTEVTAGGVVDSGHNGSMYYFSSGKMMELFDHGGHAVTNPDNCVEVGRLQHVPGAPHICLVSIHESVASEAERQKAREDHAVIQVKERDSISLDPKGCEHWRWWDSGQHSLPLLMRLAGEAERQKAREDHAVIQVKERDSISLDPPKGCEHWRWWDFDQHSLPLQMRLDGSLLRCEIAPFRCREDSPAYDFEVWPRVPYRNSSFLRSSDAGAWIYTRQGDDDQEAESSAAFRMSHEESARNSLTLVAYSLTVNENEFLGNGESTTVCFMRPSLQKIYEQRAAIRDATAEDPLPQLWAGQDRE
ncbi:hypothetical protein GGR56DRAFT_325101 [Xylariaceae sp. FL0804]|nr:hypothetical protein GGR56DRAFT_325101 [Xylariaceae sp. FL0804]